VQKEARAIRKLVRLFPKQKTLWRELEAYEKRRDPESRFVYLVEKLEPILSVLLSEPDHWLKRKVSLEGFLARKNVKLAELNAPAQFLWDDLVSLLKKRSRLFCASPKKRPTATK
jgi:5'-deoxynucleotidase YfbR-like HD superfamily hydrolase